MVVDCESVGILSEKPTGLENIQGGSAGDYSRKQQSVKSAAAAGKTAGL
jgi:hypothetical protein